MGNCQAIDAASLVLQHPNGKVDKMYWPVAATEVMKMNPGHYVALLITTTICHTTTKTDNTTPTKPNSETSNNNKKDSNNNTNNKKDNNKEDCNSRQKNSNIKGCDNKGSNTARNSVRITRVKLLRPTDTLALGHVYRLITTQEVMKGLVAKKQAKMKKSGIELADSEGLQEAEKLVRRSLQDKTHQQISRRGHRSRTGSNANGGTARPKTWQPSLNSISEATS